MLFHEKEKVTTFTLQAYLEENPGETVTCTMSDGSEFVAKLFTTYESDNEDLEDAGEYDEFNVVSLTVVKVVTQGERPLKKDDVIDIWYSSFPTLIRKSNGEILYQA